MADDGLTVNHYSSAPEAEKAISNKLNRGPLHRPSPLAISIPVLNKKTYEFGQIGVAEKTCSEISRCLKGVQLEALTHSTSVIERGHHGLH